MYKFEFKTNLSSEEMISFLDVCGKRGLSPEEMINEFIHGVISLNDESIATKYSNHFRNCINKMGVNDSFLEFMINMDTDYIDELERLISDLEFQQALRNTYLDKPEVKEDCEKEIHNIISDIDKYFEEYCRHCGKKLTRKEEETNLTVFNRYILSLREIEFLQKNEKRKKDKKSGNK